MTDRLCAWCGKPFRSTNPKTSTCCATHGAQLAARRRNEAKAAEERWQELAASEAAQAAWRGVVFPSYRMKPAPGRVDRPPTATLGQSAMGWVKG